VSSDEVKIRDKRFWARAAEDDGAGDGERPDAEAPAAGAAEIEALRQRAEGAERKLQEIQGTFVAAKADLERTRERLQRDAEKKVELRFGDLVADLLESVDDLDRAIEHGNAADAVVRGVALARERFLAALERAGVTRLDPIDAPYDPNVAEAVGVAPVDDPARHDVVVQVVRAGYALGGRIIRPARVVVGRLLA
jgi:molecular chaperone GrpE